MKTTLVRLTTALGVAGALLAVVPPTAQAQESAAHPETQAALDALQAKAGPGAGVFAGDDADEWSLSSGTATVKEDDPVGPDEHFRIGSQSKTFTAVAVLKLVEQNKVELDEPIERYLPGVVARNGHDGNRITVRHLLQHTSGIPRNTLPLAQKNPDGTYSLESLVRDGLRYDPVSEPGAAFAYSNTNYEILGMLIEKVTGLPVHEAVTSQVIQPLGLTRTVFPAPGDRAVPAPLIHGYRGIRVGSFNFWLDGTKSEPSAFYASGAVISTLKDLTAFHQGLVEGKVLSPASLAELQKSFEFEGGNGGYGLGVMRVELPCGGSAWGHNGAVPGYFSMTLVTEDGRHASVMSNAHLAINMPAAELHTAVTTALCEDAA